METSSCKRSKMMKGLMVDENMSNLTCASGEVSSSSGARNETANFYSQQSFAAPLPPPKKKRSLPGNPDPDAEVIALSPKTLLATNRFICEICNKGFQRDQNLQLHRRGHNLPWKLKKRTNNEVIRKKVYLCPEPTCVHHDPSRALGDLTGIKKHFFRKHSEKKWKCEKCSKRYAVQSDWKAHSKICGTREYRCDCGTLFSRRDSFITHRAFCDALMAEDSVRAMTSNPQPLQSQLHSHGLQAPPVKREQEHMLPPWLACPPIQEAGPGPPPIDLSSPFFPETLVNPNPNFSLAAAFQPAASPHMSATALLQKAAQMGATIRPHHAHHMSGTIGFSTSTAGSDLGLSASEKMSSGFNKAAEPSLLNDMMSSLSSASGFEGSYFDEALNGMSNSTRDGNFQGSLPETTGSEFEKSDEGGRVGSGGNEGLTRDFLGLRGFSHKDFINMPWFDQTYRQQNQNHQTPW